MWKKMTISENIFRQMIATFPVILLLLQAGITMGWVASIVTTTDTTNSEFILSTEESSWVVSLLHVGRMAGSLLSAVFIDKVGRKRILMFSALNMFFAWVIVIITRSVLMLYAARLVSGLGTGILDVTCAIYISENSTPNMRGIFSSVTVAFCNLGTLLAYTLPTYFTYNTVAYTNAGIGLITLLSSCLLKEPAQFLIAQRDEQKAENNFFGLRGRDPNTIIEFAELKMYALEQQSNFSPMLLFTDAINRKAFRIVFLLYLMMFGTGFYALGSLVTVAFSTSDSSNSDQLTILFGLFQLIAVFLSSCWVERWNRRTLMLIASAGCGIIHAITGGLYYVHGNISQLPYFAWMIFTTITVYAVIFSSVFDPLSGTIRGEILPQNIKATCGSVAMIASSGINFIQAKIFLIIADKCGIEMNFFLYSITSLLMFVYIYVDLPETRGMTLVEIQKSFKNK